MQVQMSASHSVDRDTSERKTGRNDTDLLHARHCMKSCPDLPLETVPVLHLLANHLLDIVGHIVQVHEHLFRACFVTLEQGTKVGEFKHVQWWSDAWQD